MDRLPQMEEIVRTYESMMRLMIHLYELRNYPGEEAERKSRFESCKQVSEELKEQWKELLFCDATARLDR
jgi:fructoselysine-6-P-deglycase FrlB-like protein